MAEYGVLIADSSEDFRLALGRCLEGPCRVSYCADGGQVLSWLAEHRADLLVLDLMLPGFDGLSLLQALRTCGSCPRILATSEFLSPYLLDRLGELGICRVLEKPCSLKAAVDQALTMLEGGGDPGREALRSRVSQILLQLGFCVQHRGYAYLREAVCRIVEDPDWARLQGLHRKVGRSFGTTDKQAERAIRSAIGEAWDRGDRRCWEACLGNVPAERPTNTALVRCLAAALRKEQADRLPKAAGQK